MGETAQLSFAHENFGRISSDLGEIYPMLWQVFSDLGELRPK
jgi:hypothetical protein